MSEPVDVVQNETRGPVESVARRLSKSEIRPLEKVDPRVKIVAILCASLLAVTLDRLSALLVLTALCAIPLFVARLPREQIRPMITVIVLATWGTVFSQALFYDSLPRTLLWTLLPEGKLFSIKYAGIHIYKEGLTHGLVQSVRFDGLILLGAAVCLTTSPERLFLGLIRMRAPYGISFMAVTAVRFLPLMLEELKTVMAARRLRGYRRFRSGIRTTLRVEVSTLEPVVVKALRKATDLAISLSLRAFDPAGERSSYRTLSLSLSERIGILLMVSATLTLVFLKLGFLLYLHDILYFSSLRTVYAWVRVSL